MMVVGVVVVCVVVVIVSAAEEQTARGYCRLLCVRTCELVLTLVVSTDSGPVRKSSSSLRSRSSTLMGWADAIVMCVGAKV